jgi:hypothetical protein
MGKWLIVSLWLMMGQIVQQKDKRIITSILVPKIAGVILTIFQKAFQKKALKTVCLIMKKQKQIFTEKN